MKVFPHGQSGGESPTHYLVGMEYPGREEMPPEVLRGDTDTTRALIDSIDRKWKFTAGVLSWHPDDTVSEEQEERIMNDFERVAFAGLELDQRNILWVRHKHADHHELHFLIPRLELTSGNGFNACPPGWQKHFDVFRDLANIRENWARPDDPARARLHTPEHADLHKARLIRWGATPGKDERAEAKEAIHAYVMEKIGQGLVHDRQSLLACLREAGLEINRDGKTSVTVKDPQSGEKLRMKGGVYAAHWKIGNGVSIENETVRETPEEETARLEAQLVQVLEKRAQYNLKHYPRKDPDLEPEELLALPDVSKRKEETPHDRSGTRTAQNIVLHVPQCMRSDGGLRQEAEGSGRKNDASPDGDTSLEEAVKRSERCVQELADLVEQAERKRLEQQQAYAYRPRMR